MQGQYMEVETGLCYNTFRYYDPDIGRFISEDPIGLLGGTNLYGFAPNTDGWIDPWGWAYKSVDFTGSSDLYPAEKGQRNTVKITMQGSRKRDFTQANRSAGIKKTPGDYTWHHVGDFDPKTGTTTMQLVKTEAHEKTFPHSGSVSQFEKHFGVKYDTNAATTASQKAGWLSGRKPTTVKKPTKGC
jgi:RHS repeat-associated protein